MSEHSGIPMIDANIEDKFAYKSLLFPKGYKKGEWLEHMNGLVIIFQIKQLFLITNGIINYVNKKLGNFNLCKAFLNEIIIINFVLDKN